MIGKSICMCMDGPNSIVEHLLSKHLVLGDSRFESSHFFSLLKKRTHAWKIMAYNSTSSRKMEEIIDFQAINQKIENSIIPECLSYQSPCSYLGPQIG